MIYYGQPATIANIPTPAAEVNIASSTATTPIVVTTSGAHGLQTGMVVIIAGHLVNTNANGVRQVLVLSGTTFSLKTLSGTNVASNGTGAATGTVQSLALPGVTLPEDAVTNIDASSVNVPFEALLDMTAWLAYNGILATRDLKALGIGLELVGPGALWTGDIIAGGDGLALQTVQTSGQGDAVLTLLHSIRIRTVKVRLVPDTHAALPGSMPTLTLRKITINGAGAATWTQIDTSATVGAYNTPHDITLDLGADETIDKTAFFYVAQIEGEGGANAVDLKIGQPRILMLPPAIP